MRYREALDLAEVEHRARVYGNRADETNRQRSKGNGCNQ
jgi:hypothetical protein